MHESLSLLLGEKTHLFIESLAEKEKTIIKLKPKRQSKYGDFRPAFYGKQHLITVNYDENRYRILLVLLHEIAHAEVWNKYGRKHKPHGQEWKSSFKKLVLLAMKKEFFVPEFYAVLLVFIENPKSSHQHNSDLMKTLKNFDNDMNGEVFLSELAENELFVFREKIFRKGQRIRSRYKCSLYRSKKEYLFNPNASVKLYEIS
jgi:SprT protein